MEEISVYLHIPFCRRRCGYCDFNTFAGLTDLIPKYVKALCTEIEIVATQNNGETEINTIFFGGGTPSLLSVDQLDSIITQLRCSFSIQTKAEITLEANPGTVTKEALSQLHQIGFNRVSFGMQSAAPQDLMILDRQHEFLDVVHAVEWSKVAGFQHINLDLIFGIPGQSMQRWQENLEIACRFNVEHLSLYSLIIEEGTPFARWERKGMLDPIDEETVAGMYEYAIDFLGQSGYTQYEISNWALNRADGQDARCQHNLNTWHYRPYFGFGAGASGFIGNERTLNVGPISIYLERMSKGQGSWPAVESVISLDMWDEMQEWMMIGMRLTDEGISKKEFNNRFGTPIETVFAKQISRLLDQGLIETFCKGNDRLRLTHRGRLLGNQVFMQFVGNKKPKTL